MYVSARMKARVTLFIPSFQITSNPKSRNSGPLSDFHYIPIIYYIEYEYTSTKIN